MPREKLVGQTDGAEPSEALDLQKRDQLFPIPASVATTKATKRSLAKIQQNKFLEHAEPMLDEFYQILRMKLRRGDSTALKIVQEVCGLSPAKGPSVVAQFYNKNEANARADANSAAVAQAAGDRSVEDLIKRLDARDTKISQAIDFIEAV